MKSANGYSARRATPMKRPHRSLVPTPESRQSFTIALSPPRVPREIAPRAGDGMLSLAGLIAFPIELLRGAAPTLPAVKIAAVTRRPFQGSSPARPWLLGSTAGWCSPGRCSTRSAPSSGDRFASMGHLSCAGALRRKSLPRRCRSRIRAGGLASQHGFHPRDVARANGSAQDIFRPDLPFLSRRVDAAVGLGSFLAASGGRAACRIGRGQPLQQGLPGATGLRGQEAADIWRAALTWPAVGARAIKKIRESHRVANLIALRRREVVASLEGHWSVPDLRSHISTQKRRPLGLPRNDLK
jgi:hypothetical protein